MSTFRTKLASASEESTQKHVKNQLEESELALQDCISRSATAHADLAKSIKQFNPTSDRDGILDAAKQAYARGYEIDLPIDVSLVPPSTTSAPSPSPAPAAPTPAVPAVSAVSPSVEGKANAPSPNKEQTFVLIKPDGVQRGLHGKILDRFAERGLKIVAMKFIKPDVTLVEKHYKEHETKPFYPRLVNFLTSGPVVAIVLEGFGVVKAVRGMCGATNPLVSETGSIRGDFATYTGKNIVHSSDSVDSAQREIALWFPEGVIQWDWVLESQFYE